MSLAELKARGSPPPTRGTLVNPKQLKAVLRITPAYAGNTKLESVIDVVDKDHPRLRGEHRKATAKKG